MASIKFDHVCKTFGEFQAVSDLNLDVEDGEFLVFVGPSGCGKSTTLRMLAGLESPSDGRIWIGDKDVTALPPGRRDIAMVFQSYALYPHMSIYKNLSFGLEVRKNNSKEIERKIREVASVLRLDNLLSRSPGELSGGQRQRVALGRAMIREPRLFLLDEPLSNLDAALRTHMRTEIAELQRRLGTTMVYVTHDQVEAMSMGHRIAVFSGGKLLQIDTPERLYRRPIDRYVATFIGSPRMNIVDSVIKLSDSNADCNALGASFRLPPAQRAEFNGSLPQRIEVGIRPGDLHWVKDAPGRCAVRTAGMVQSIETTGSENFVRVAIGNSTVDTRFPGFAEVGIGDRVELVFDPEDLHYFDADTGRSLRH
ncbi:ABC transporter ATP-binding protein [Paraburkholderia sp. RP-4-7]|uniref:ABC transporter ATP-binding protein n=1 Tax=Paraburkholderia polaris TaxID=2728848 RepID=A0A848IHX8_9BURK|nr:ABC transporter ATP-binding protein [Paraburkholderia polaris]NML99036.1 ABC transporter ATP-binding protein [Paraburkholderia polaris]